MSNGCEQKMTELKLYFAESYYLNENYQIFAESEDEVLKMLVDYFKEMDYDEPEDIEVQIVDYYEVKKQIIRAYCPEW